MTSLLRFLASPGGLRARLALPFLRNLGAMGGAQLAMRISRLLTTLLLARQLSATDFGLAAMVLTVYELVALFTRNGITAKVVQAAPAEAQAMAETAYRLTWILCLALMLLQWAIALTVAYLYHAPRLALPIALMGLIYLATPLCSMQCAFMQREGRLGRIALASGLQVSVDNALTAILALCGLGMWAIVLPKLLVAPIWVIVTRTGHDWRPNHSLPWRRTMQGWQEIARFSRSVIGVELMTTAQANIDNLLVGYFLGVKALGVYYFAFNAGLGITLGLVNAFGVAVYPHLCQVRIDPVALTARFRQAQRTVGGILVPVALAQTLLAPVYVPLVFGHKWEAAVPVLMLICLSALIRPFASVCAQLLRAAGRPDVELRWQIAATAILSAALLAAVQFNITAVAAAVLAVQSLVLGAFCLIAPRPYLAPKRDFPAQPALLPGNA